jgi:uncharacterized phage protein (TIGR02220 family)
MSELCKIGFFEVHPKSKELGMSLYAPTDLLDSIHFKTEPTEKNPMPYGLKTVPPSGSKPMYYIYNDNKENNYHVNNNIDAEINSAGDFHENFEDSFFDSDGLDAHGEGKKEKSSAKKERKLEDAPHYSEAVTVLNRITELKGSTNRIPTTYDKFVRYGGYKAVLKRLKAGATVEQMLKVVELKANEWLPSVKMAQYFTYDTLFADSNFEKYLDQIEIIARPKPVTKANNKIETHDTTRDQIHLLKSALMRAKIYDSRFDNMPDALALTEMQKALENHKKQTT